MGEYSSIIFEIVHNFFLKFQALLDADDLNPNTVPV
jgi:hypothetical protein